ncbi:IS1634 family transposase [Succinatimonas hippei]|uniref:Transposase, IS4 family n=1 Tax=Succinatimonas hippei (strain DSM 22608 / JCM 16073 / KCTC 15190 / YIT 12066) TaxID=762983 RepID=E8LJV5_SUCHY|nr:transposase [Succinatimonas hippei]EFY07185.1 transposase, IS4 family [Succinatimonas hippei YIT 12066]
MAVMNIPKLPPLKHVKNGKYCYLVTFKNVWLDGKSVTVPGSTKTVGKIEGGKVVGKVIWTDAFAAEHPELEALDAYRMLKNPDAPSGKRRYFIRFEPHNEMVSLRKVLNASSFVAGPSWVLDHIIADTPLTKALNSVFSDYCRNRKIVSLAYYMYLFHTTAVESYGAFAENYRLPWQVPLRPGQCSKLFKSISSKEINGFLKKLNEEVCKLEAENVGGGNVYYALDSTSVSTYARHLIKAQYGHNKDGDALKQINILMMVNQETGLPVYYRTYDGDVPDVSTIMHTLRDTVRLGVNRQAVAVCDRGYSSIINLHRFYQSEASFVMNMRTSFRLARDFIIEHRQELEAPDSYIPAIGQHAVSTTKIWKYPVNFTTDCAKRRPQLKADMHVHIFFDENIKHERKQLITKALACVRTKLAAKETLANNEKCLAERFLIIKKDDAGNILSVKTDTAKLAEYLFTAGYRVLVSDCVTGAVEAHRAYQMRNSVEEAFAVMKQDIGGRRFGTSTDSTTEGKIFTVFIAAAIGLMFKTRISQCKTKGMQIPFEGDRAVMTKLSGIKATLWEDGMYYTEVTGKKRELLEALDIPLPDAAVFTKAELENMKEDDAAEEEETFIANNVEELAAALAEV